ncbi:hypothetical protein SDC9_107736 [bioreactor metagenome]|uniref:NAD-specific glutamate dehydrogenase n=1 Tax=bioreactor metagenome TaxID=1076179 RepID=A0A645B648_9ZZZZ
MLRDPLRHLVQHFGNLVDVGRKRIADDAADGKLDAFDRRQEAAERSADAFVHFGGGLRRRAGNVLQFLDEFVQLLDVAAELKTGKRAAQVENLLREREALGRRHLRHRLGDVRHDVRHRPQIPVRVDGGDADLLELVLDVRLGELRIRLAESRSGEGTLDAHVGEDAQRGGDVDDVVLRGGGLRTRHLQAFRKVSQRLRRTVRGRRQDVRHVRHFGRLDAKHPHVVGRDLGGFRKIRPGRAGEVQDGGNRRFDLFGVESHASHGRHPVRHLFRRKTGFAPQSFSDLGQPLEFLFGRAGDRLDHPHLVVEIGERLGGERERSRRDGRSRHHAFSRRGERRAEILQFHLGRLEAALQFGLVEHDFDKRPAGLHITACTRHRNHLLVNDSAYKFSLSAYFDLKIMQNVVMV